MIVICPTCFVDMHEEEVTERSVTYECRICGRIKKFSAREIARYDEAEAEDAIYKENGDYENV